MKFYISPDHLNNIQPKYLYIPQYNDLAYGYISIKQNFYIYYGKKYIQIYLFPVFNIDTQESSLLLVYNNTRKIIKNENYLYDFVTLLSIQYEDIKQPILISSRKNELMSFDLYALASWSNIINSFYINKKLQYFNDNCIKININDFINEFNILQLVKWNYFMDKQIASVDLFNSPYYLFYFIKSFLPEIYEKYKSNFVYTDYYYNRALLWNKSINVNKALYISFKTIESAKIFIESLEPTFLIKKAD